MIIFISGMPGDGKSLFATAQILRDLVDGYAYVVTNVPLIPSAVCAYVSEVRARRNDPRPFEFDESVRVLADEEVFEFYRRRSGGLVLEPSPDFIAQDDGRQRLEKKYFNERMKAQFLTIKDTPGAGLPVHYYIDEAHDFFSAREWSKTGRGILFYASKHRHLHDNIWFITQVMDNVEKQLRSLASETHRVRNHLRRSVGPFRLRPVFKVQKFYGVPAAGGNAQSYATEEMHLDPSKVAGCYRTVGALGVQSKPEQIKNRAPLPWWSVWVAAGIGIALLMGAFLGLPYLGSAFAKNTIQGTQQLVTKQTGISPTGSDARAASASRSDVTAVNREAVPPPVWVTGLVVRGDQVNVILSDGRTLTERGGDLARVERNYVETTKGERYYMARPASASQTVRDIQPAQMGPQGVINAQRSDVRDEGAWVLGPDGVRRLKVPEVLRSSALSR